MLEQIEQRAGGVRRAYKLLGVTEQTWHGYKSGRRAVPVYIKRSIKAHLALSNRAFTRLMLEAK